MSAGNNHAVVIGGSVAGLLAARILSDHFARVTLIERDLLIDEPISRKGVPQGRHFHALHRKGEQVIARLFPDITSELIEAGATRLDCSADILWFQRGGYKTREPSGITLLSMSRPLLELHIRRRVLALKNLIYLDQCDVESLTASEDRTRITGVKIRRRGASAEKDESAERILTADIVVDATGRGSKSPKWLEELGYVKPPESVVKVNVGYATRVFRRDPELLPNAKAIFTLPAPPDGKRAGGLFPVEKDRWIVTLGGLVGDHPPADEKGFLEYAKSLANQDVYNVINRAEPLTGIVTHRCLSNLRRSYERIKSFPEGYLIIGDAICSFNPVYGQGMSVSAMEAEALDACLKAVRAQGDLRGLARKFFKQAAKIIGDAWAVAVGEDFRFAGVEGVKPFGTDLMNKYVSEIHKASLRDPEMTRALLRVMTMTHSPKTLFSPRVALRVVRNRLLPKQTQCFTRF